jgi:DNA mismatch repair protein MutS
LLPAAARSASSKSLPISGTRQWQDGSLLGIVDMVRGPRSNVIGLDGVRRPVAASDLAGSARRSFYSILFTRSDDRISDDAVSVPEFFADLNCDQIVEAITAGKVEYNLKPFFHAPLQRVDSILYRQEVMRDLEQPALYERILSFAGKMREIREHLRRADKAHYAEQKQAWFLDAADIYCASINSFATQLASCDLRSQGLLAFRDYLAGYARSNRFNALLRETTKLRAALSEIEYCVVIRGSSFTVCKYDEETDYSADVEDTFAKFKQGAVNDYKIKFPASVDMNHVEAKIAEFVAKLHPEVFLVLGKFCSEYQNFMDRDVVVFDREVQFYVAYLEYCAALKRASLPLCYPVISETDKEVYDRDAFDIALAHKLIAENATVVCNDFYVNGGERILVVSGPNQGGKSTFARMFGQLHYLASIGCPVPGREAQLFLFDQLFTHFEKQEKVENIRGKLEDDLVRVHAILNSATPRSIIIMNEIFTTTTIQDEAFLSKKIMEKIIQLGALCVWVTFVDELASFAPQTVSMTSTVVTENPAIRTFKVVRRPADGLAYAMAIAQKYRLTYSAIRERVSR